MAYRYNERTGVFEETLTARCARQIGTCLGRHSLTEIVVSILVFPFVLVALAITKGVCPVFEFAWCVLKWILRAYLAVFVIIWSLKIMYSLWRYLV